MTFLICLFCPTLQNPLIFKGKLQLTVENLLITSALICTFEIETDQKQKGIRTKRKFKLQIEHLTFNKTRHMKTSLLTPDGHFQNFLTSYKQNY